VSHVGDVCHTPFRFLLLHIVSFVLSCGVVRHAVCVCLHSNVLYYKEAYIKRRDGRQGTKRFKIVYNGWLFVVCCLLLSTLLFFHSGRH
jgi:hypothetical protein